MRAALIWGGLGLALALPLGAAALSPLLAWREPVYIAAGFAGVIGLGLLLVQPLLALGLLPGLSAPHARRIHGWTGASLVAAVILHVVGLWITSPPDVIDALTFTSPTPFSIWGVLAMWGIFANALLAVTWRRLHLHPRLWRRAHLALAALIAGGTIAHALLIDGTMELLTKLGLCLLVGLAVTRALVTRWGTRR
ncbi:ferric reductase-like transmembrane domain-containing protein [Dinoroseobacter sp. S124A]|uniref:ferric reductase-like transmembrane domain-containing protein n=1 Tax=Dinoroseobacter sp. S124A TaxID=3415128 RepID=UPI003C7C8AD9